MKNLITIISLLSFLLILGCASEKKAIKKEEENLGPLTTLPSGLKYYEMKQGSGAFPKLKQKVTVHMIIKTEGGLPIENTYTYDTPIKFEIGNDEVIKGLEEGIATMKPGSKRRLIIPASLGFGSRNIKSVPSNSILVCDVELVKID